MSQLIVTPAWHLDNWRGNYIDDDGVRWFVSEDQGWFGPVESRVFDSDRPTQGGTYSSASLDTVRVVTLTGECNAPTAALADAARHRFNALCRTGHLHQLLVEEPVENKQAWVKRSGGNLVNQSPTRFNFQLILTAPDPLKYSTTVTIASTRLALDAPGGILWEGAASSGGTLWAGTAGTTGLEYQTGSGENGVLILTNSGTADAPVTFTIAGPVTEPSIIRADTEDTLTWNGTVADGSFLEINTGTGSVLLNGTNQRPLLTRADFFTIPPATDIEVSFRAPTPSPTAELVASWPNAWY